MFRLDVKIAMPLKLITYNIQAAIGTKAYSQYVTQARLQLFHSKSKMKTLQNISGVISNYDVACLQEVDLGGRRSGFKSQVDEILLSSDYGFASVQENRTVGNISRHGNAILSKYPQSDICDLKLPGKRAGRGAILAKIEAPKPFYVLNVHLSLGRADQIMQVEYLAEHAPKDQPVIITGDFNCGASSLPLSALASLLEMKRLTTPADKTYPSWNPRKDLDHILVSKHFSVQDIAVERAGYSDHLPVTSRLLY